MLTLILKFYINVKVYKYIFKYVYKIIIKLNFRIKRVNENSVINSIKEIQKYRNVH